MTTAAVLTGLVLPIAGGTTLIRAASPELWRRSRILVIGLGAVTGIGISSLLFATVLFTFDAPCVFYVPLDIAFWVIVSTTAVLASRRRPAGVRTALAFTRLEIAATLVFAATLTLSLLHFYLATLNSPSGEWDAWAIWNLRARFLYRGLEGHWRDAFDAALRWSNPNNLLMLPSSTARLWLYARAETAMAPILLAFVFTYAAAAILVGAFMAMGRRLEGFLAGAILLATYAYNFWGPAQVSDVPVAAFVLAATVLMSRILDDRREAATAVIALLMFSACCAAWTKNEGLVFAAAVGAVLTWVILIQRPVVFRGVILAAAGLAWPVLVVLYFKLALAPPSYLLERVSMTAAPPQLWHLERHRYILQSFARELRVWPTEMPVGIIPVIVLYAVAASLAFGLRRRRLGAALPLLAMLLGYYGAYLVTPNNLKWQIDVTMSRLLVQIWPATLFVLVSLTAPFGAADPAAAVGARQGAFDTETA